MNVMCVCVYVIFMCVLCGVVVVSLAGPEVPEFKPHPGTFHLVFHLPPTSCDWGPDICWVQIQGLHETTMVQVGLRVPTPLAVRKGLLSCEFLAWLQELCLHGSQCLLSAQAFWLCQVHMTA